MADKPLIVQIAKTIVSPLIDEQHAPFIFFDAVPNYGEMPGIITVTLSASRMLPDEQGNIHTKQVPVAYLRSTISAAQQLAAALQQALAMAAATQGSTQGAVN